MAPGDGSATGGLISEFCRKIAATARSEPADGGVMRTGEMRRLPIADFGDPPAQRVLCQRVLYQRVLYQRVLYQRVLYQRVLCQRVL